MTRSRSSSRACTGLKALLVLAILWSPTIVHACAVCSAGNEEESRTAYVIGTAFMTLMPFAVVGVFLWWLRTFLRRSEAEHEAARTLEPLAVTADGVGSSAERHAPQ